MKSKEDVLCALEECASRMGTIDPSCSEAWRELLSHRQQLIEDLLFLLDSNSELLERGTAARIAGVFEAGERTAERLRVHRAWIRSQMANNHRTRFLCQSLAAPAQPTIQCRG